MQTGSKESGTDIAKRRLFLTLLGMAAVLWTVPVRALPVITDHPAEVSTKLNAFVQFEVQASGQGLSYQWRRNAVNIPGATDDVYMVDEVRPEDAGNYSVVVSDATGAVLSQSALLFLENLPQVQPGDDFAQRTFLQGESGILASDNIGASRESGEPLHAGKFGNRSVWYAWLADFDGIATFHTRGSAFDTLLAAYEGESLGRLNALAGDDDNGGSRTSEIRFNAFKGREYWIAIDGLGGDEGVFVLNWFLEDSGEPIPEIKVQPQSQTVRPGDSASFNVSIAQQGNYFYQWHFNGEPIMDALEPAYQIGKVGPEHVGTYQVHILDARQRTVISQPAVLELGPDFPVQSVDKALDLIAGEQGLRLTNPNGDAALSAASASSGSRISFSLGVGSTVSQTMNNSGSVPEPDVAPHCAINGGADRWITLQPVSDGFCEIDTEGSHIDTVIAVYEWTGSILSTVSRPLACNDDIVPRVKVQSRVLFEAQAGVIYWVAMDGREGAQGVINFNIRFGLPPVSNLPGPPFRLVLPKGSDWSLQAGFAANAFPLTYRWWRSGAFLPGATGSLLNLASLQIADSGDYRVEASNFAGATVNDLGIIVVDSLDVGAGRMNDAGHFGFPIRGDPGQHARVEASQNFNGWTLLDDISFTSATVLYDFIDEDAPLFPRRFYRVVPVWP